MAPAARYYQIQTQQGASIFAGIAIIVHILLQKTSLFLQNGEGPPPPSLSPIALASGGLKLPPFPSRKREETNPNEGPKSYMTEDEANELKGFIFEQLHEFEECVHAMAFLINTDDGTGAHRLQFNAFANCVSIRSSSTSL